MPLCGGPCSGLQDTVFHQMARWALLRCPTQRGKLPLSLGNWAPCFSHLQKNRFAWQCPEGVLYCHNSVLTLGKSAALSQPPCALPCPLPPAFGAKKRVWNVFADTFLLRLGLSPTKGRRKETATHVQSGPTAGFLVATTNKSRARLRTSLKRLRTKLISLAGFARSAAAEARAINCPRV